MWTQSPTHPWTPTVQSGPSPRDCPPSVPSPRSSPACARSYPCYYHPRPPSSRPSRPTTGRVPRASCRLRRCRGGLSLFRGGRRWGVGLCLGPCLSEFVRFRETLEERREENIPRGSPIGDRRPPDPDFSSCSWGSLVVGMCSLLLELLVDMVKLVFWGFWFVGGYNKYSG